MPDGAPELGKLLGLRRCLLTPCLQPQMKTYRCPWCVSRTNHNIWYFGHISRTSSLNPAICLWKLRFSLVGRGFRRHGNAPNLEQRRGVARGPVVSLLNPSPGLTPAQGAEPVHFACASVQVVDIRAIRLSISARGPLSAPPSGRKYCPLRLIWWSIASNGAPHRLRCVRILWPIMKDIADPASARPDPCSRQK